MRAFKEDDEFELEKKVIKKTKPSDDNEEEEENRILNFIR